MYLVAADRVVALDPETGNQMWEYVMTDAPPSRRGVAYWDGEAADTARIFVTAGSRLFALGAPTGEALTAFGENGSVDISRPYNGAPTIYQDLVILGTSAAPGAVRAFDARTGEAVWEFRPVPEAGAVGSETWEAGDLANRGGTHHWAFSMTIDEERGTLYAVFEHQGRSTTGVETGTVTICSAIPSLRWMPKPVTSNGIFKLSITTSGTTTFLHHRAFSTSPSTVRPFRFSRSQPRPGTCTSSIG